MPVKLSPEECVALTTLKTKGQSNAQIARTLGVSEGTVRYRLRRPADDVQDRRRNKPHRADPLAPVIDHFIGDGQPPETDSRAARPINVRALHDYLTAEHQYPGSYRSVLRFVQAHYPAPKLRPFRRLGGIPAVLRIDNLKTGIARGAGPWGQINLAYRRCARCVGFHIDACLPRCPEDKGKVENRIGVLQRRLRLRGPFPSLATLQGDSDAQLERWAERRTCPATGLSVQASWQEELPCLRPLPLLPEVFDVAVTRTVHTDCTVNFEGRTYSVPFVLCGRRVEVRGCACVVQVLHEGQIVAEHPRASRQRLLIDPAHYDGPGDDRVAPPVPLGRMGRRLQQILIQPVEQRPLDLYAALAEVAR